MEVGCLLDRRQVVSKPKLLRWYNFVFSDEISCFDLQECFKDFGKPTKQTDGPVICWQLRVFNTFEDRDDDGVFPLSGDSDSLDFSSA